MARRNIIELVEQYNGIPFPERWEFAYDIASAYVARGEREHAYRWLYRAVLTGYPAHLAYEDPLMEPLHDDPAYQQLIRQTRIRVEGEWDKAIGTKQGRQRRPSYKIKCEGAL